MNVTAWHILIFLMKSSLNSPSGYIPLSPVCVIQDRWAGVLGRCKNYARYSKNPQMHTCLQIWRMLFECLHWWACISHKQWSVSACVSLNHVLSFAAGWTWRSEKDGSLSLGRDPSGHTGAVLSQSSCRLQFLSCHFLPLLTWSIYTELVFSLEIFCLYFRLKAELVYFIQLSKVLLQFYPLSCLCFQVNRVPKAQSTEHSTHYLSELLLSSNCQFSSVTLSVISCHGCFLCIFFIAHQFKFPLPSPSIAFLAGHSHVVLLYGRFPTNSEQK